MKSLCAIFCVAAVLPTADVLATPLPVPTSNASHIDIMGLRLGMSPAEIKPILEAAVSGIQVNVQESTWPDGTKFVSQITGTWKIPNKNNPFYVTRGETLNVHFTAPASGNKSYWITRSATFFDGQEVSKEATLQAVVGKYGKPIDIGQIGVNYTWTYGDVNGYSDHAQFAGSFGNCTDNRFNSNCPDVFLTFNAMQALVPTLLQSINLVLKDNKYGLASLQYDQQMRATAQKAAEEKAGKIAGAPRL